MQEAEQQLAKGLPSLGRREMTGSRDDDIAGVGQIACQALGPVARSGMSNLRAATRAASWMLPSVATGTGARGRSCSASPGGDRQGFMPTYTSVLPNCAGQATSGSGFVEPAGSSSTA